MTQIQLGTAEELPVDYRERLEQLNVLPAWTQLRSVLPIGAPSKKAQSSLWRYAELREQMLRAGDLVPVEKSERRVLAYINPGISSDRMSTLPSIFFGLQLIMPGERAPNHKHSPAAVRIILEGEGAYTTVDDEKIVMEVGDVVLTPPWTWHDHGHEGSAPVIWMDVLDHPLVVPYDISYLITGDLADSYANTVDSGDSYYSCPGLVPYRTPGAPARDYPLCRFRWSRVRAALDAVADTAGRDEAVHLRYVNPDTGESIMKTLDFSARALRPGEVRRVDPCSANRAFLVLGGRCEIAVNGEAFSCDVNDTLAVPTYSDVELGNDSGAACYLIQVDDTPMQLKLGFYETKAA